MSAEAIPPAPQRLPPALGEGLELEMLRRDPLAFLVESTTKYGDIFRYTAGGWSAVVLNHPSYIRYVLHADSQIYSKVGTPDLMMLKPMLGEGLMTSEGESWAGQRHTAQPHFQRRRVDAYVPHMGEAVGQMLDRWEEHAASGERVDVENEMSRLTLQIVARCLFGMDLGDEEGEFGAAVGAMNDYMGHFDLHDGERLRQFQQAVVLLDRIVQRIVLERQFGVSGTDDLLATLIAAQEAEAGGHRLRDQIFTFLMAGHETTAKALTWTLYLLDQHPAVWGRLRQEVDDLLAGRPPDAGDIDRLAYTWMVIQEAMRLYPPVWLMSRYCRQDDCIDGYVIPAGTLVIVSPYAMHRHPAYWPEPLAFNPERFQPARVVQQAPYTYFPFSGGPRACIGRMFATLETVLVLSSIVQRFRLRLEPGHPVTPDALVTLRPKYGLPMTLGPVATPFRGPARP